MLVIAAVCSLVSGARGEAEVAVLDVTSAAEEAIMGVPLPKFRLPPVIDLVDLGHHEGKVGPYNYTRIVAKKNSAPPILTPSLKNQTITKMRLRNGMGVYIISDDALESSAMGVGVEVGSWSDPDEALGMAHFVEHMMFMGTKQHPKPGGFDEFLAANGAQISNAATGSSSTCYAFATPHAAFKAGIKRFAEFFTDPLFDSHGAAKEMHAVNQEFEMHKDEDGYRQYMVSKQLGNPQHPGSRFSIGNLDTLSKVANDQLVKWYKGHYSANLMHIAVYTALPASELEGLIAESFDSVVNRNYQRLTVVKPVNDEKLMKKVVHTKPEREVRSIGLEWELSPFFAHKMNSSPDRMVSYVLGDEGVGSLAARLREKHLALSVSAGMQKEGRDNAVFGVDISLTETGMAKRDAVIGLVFKAIHGAKKAFAGTFPKYIWEEERTRDINSWKLQSRTADTFDAAMGAVRSMFAEPLESYPLNQSVVSHFDPDGARDILDALVPAKACLSQMGGKFPPPNMEGAVQTEKYYKAKFAVEALPEATIQMWEDILEGKQVDAIEPLWPHAEKYKIPPPNPYIVKDPKVGQIDPATPVFPALPAPKLVTQDKFGKLYVGVDTAFGDPYILASIQIKTAGAISKEFGTKGRIMTNLWTDCLGEALKPKMYPFSLAGLGASVSQGKGTNLYVSVSGSTPVKKSYMAALQLALAPMKQDLSVYTTKDTFQMIKKAVIRYYKNKMKSGARETASSKLWTTFSNTRAPVEEKLGIAQNITFEEVQSFVPRLLSKISLEGFIYGSITESDATEVYQSVLTTLKSPAADASAASEAPAASNATVKSLKMETDTIEAETLTEMVELGETSDKVDVGPGPPNVEKTPAALPESEEFHSEMLVLPDTQGPWYLPSSGSARSNATILLIDGGHLPCAEAMALPVLYKEVGNLFFRELRTKQQTGYVASSYATTVARRTVVLMLVESSWAGAGDLLKRFEAFNEMVLKGVNDGSIMPKKKLDSIRASMLSSFEKPVQNIGGMAGILGGIIKEYDGDFDAEKKKQKILEGLNRDTIVSVANKVLSPKNKRRFAVLYSPDGAHTDTIPAPYQLFSKSVGKFQPKPKYRCDICVNASCPATAPKASPSTPPANDTSGNTSDVLVSLLDAF
jgi:insulysin